MRSTRRVDQGDQNLGDDSTWFSLKGVGLLRLTPELDRIDVIGGDAAIVQANIHGATVIRHERSSLAALSVSAKYQH